MKKNYTIPEIFISKFDVEDIIQDSAVAAALKNEVGGVAAVSYGVQNFKIFE